MSTLRTAKSERRRPVPANLAPFAFKSGQSGNPGGRTVDYYECQMLARQASAGAMNRLIELIYSQDERVALLAADKVLERAWGKPREQPDRESEIDKMSPAERHRYLGELLAFAASLKVPDDFVTEGDIEDVGPEKEPENG
jgi:hypothetical protein